MYDAVLVPTDGSDAASAGVTHGLDLAAAFDAVVHVLYVVPETESASIVGGAGGPDGEDVQAVAEEATETVVAAAEDRGLDTETAVHTGTPHREILAYAADEDVDLVVMATHGRSGITRFLNGSVTERVVRNADRPVLVARRKR
ncbi:universal stress protein [Halobacterium zhouii]|uniref:universal stress protein n=1 Tax=Halobacterium zhouii TaxID=2902624 RepID=UPI001E2B072E|nr:universal stress protein [Halobacterium zhouii]